LNEVPPEVVVVLPLPAGSLNPLPNVANALAFILGPEDVNEEEAAGLELPGFDDSQQTQEVLM
jgi:hypothetical protein